MALGRPIAHTHAVYTHKRILLILPPSPCWPTFHDRGPRCPRKATIFLSISLSLILSHSLLFLLLLFRVPFKIGKMRE